jgi:hypothetical protein
MTAQIGADGLDLLGDPLRELLTDVTGVQPQPGREWVHPRDKLGFRSIQRLVIRDVAGSVVMATWPAELAEQARYLYGGGLGSRGCCDRARMGSRAVAPHWVLASAAGQTVVHASVVGRGA